MAVVALSECPERPDSPVLHTFATSGSYIDSLSIRKQSGNWWRNWLETRCRGLGCRWKPQQVEIGIATIHVCIQKHTTPLIPRRDSRRGQVIPPFLTSPSRGGFLTSPTHRGFLTFPILDLSDPPGFLDFSDLLCSFQLDHSERECAPWSQQVMMLFWIC